MRADRRHEEDQAGQAAIGAYADGGTLEGTAFRAFPATVAGTAPVYRHRYP